MSKYEILSVVIQLGMLILALLSFKDNKKGKK
jgi:hypothetical protein